MTFGTFTYGSAPAQLQDTLSLEAKVALQIKLSMDPFNRAIITAMQDAADRMVDLERSLGMKVISPHLQTLIQRLSAAR